jgi:large subunit ribosomal protein L24
MAAKIKKGDAVIVLTGKDKGRKGTVNKVLPEDNRAFVTGINMVSRHVKPSQANPQGGIIRKEASIHLSNLALADPKTGEATRVGFKIDGDKKVRYAKKSGEVING